LFSWWWARRCPKHVESRIKNIIFSASGWLFLNLCEIFLCYICRFQMFNTLRCTTTVTETIIQYIVITSDVQYAKDI
jgi:hypothetical protein